MGLDVPFKHIGLLNEPTASILKKVVNLSFPSQYQGLIF